MPKDDEFGLVSFDFKDVLNILTYFKTQDHPTETGRVIMARCEELISVRLQELSPLDVTSGNYLSNHVND